MQGQDDDDFSCLCPNLLILALEALMKTQNDVVRINCIALLTVLAQKGYFEQSFSNDASSSYTREGDEFKQTKQVVALPLITLLADSIKGPLLSADAQVQKCALDLIFHSLSFDPAPIKQIQHLVEESISDYVFEVLRLSENNDHLVLSSIRVLGLLSGAKQAFRQNLAIGFPTLLLVLRHVAGIPLHPVQSHTLKLVSSCISECPGIVSRSQIEELSLILCEMFSRDAAGEIGMLSETFTMACSTFVALLKLPCSRGIPKLASSVQEVSKNAVVPSLCVPRRNPKQVFLYALFLLKESYTYSHEENFDITSDNTQLSTSIVDICEAHILPWVRRILDEAKEDEEVIMGVFETFHSILLVGSDVQAGKFADTLASSSWFTLSFGYMGLFPSDQMKHRAYWMLSSIIDGVLGHEFGQVLRDAFVHLPSDPLDFLFLLEQRSAHDSDLISGQAAVLLILYISSLLDERLAEEKQVLASLEQYILVNNSNFLCGKFGSTTLTQLVHLYSLLRVQMSHQTPYGPQAERLLFRLIVEKDWDLFPRKIHPAALKWLFQQDKIIISLSKHVLNFCKLNNKNNTEYNSCENNKLPLEIPVVAELVTAEGSCGASLLVSLLRELHKDDQIADKTSVVNLMVDIINVFPVASDQFCLHGICDAMRSLYYSRQSSPAFFTTSSILVFNILHSAHPKMLLDHDAWLPITIKLLEYLMAKLDSDTCDRDGHLVMSIFALVLHHSTNQALTEASAAILLSNSLISAVNNIIQTACAKGPALLDNGDETSNGETLTFVLLLNFFSLRSSHALLQGTIDWRQLLHSSNGMQSLSVISISCHDLCRLIHFGPASVKLIASQCLLELLTRVSEQRSSKNKELSCSVRYLQSLMAVLEGLVFYESTDVAMNCGLCLSLIFGWEMLGLSAERAIQEDNWCRVVMEELALSLAAPSFASKSFTNQHKPATHIATTLLKLDQVPKWMQSVFDGRCISGIIDNLSATNVTVEMVQLFRELMAQKYLESEQIAGLNRVFQACKKHAYMANSQEQHKEECFNKVVFIPDDLKRMREVLIHLMSATSVASGRVQSEKMRLLEEIEFFSLESSALE